MELLLADPLLKGVEAEVIFVDGDPAAEIARVAFEKEIDLVTVVTRVRSRFSRAFGSSVTEEIVAESPCPVLVIRLPSARDLSNTAKARRTFA